MIDQEKKFIVDETEQRKDLNHRSFPVFYQAGYILYQILSGRNLVEE